MSGDRIIGTWEEPFGEFKTITSVVEREITYVLSAHKLCIPNAKVYRDDFKVDNVGYLISKDGKITRDLSEAFSFKMNQLITTQQLIPERDSRDYSEWQGRYMSQITFYRNGLYVKAIKYDDAQKWLDQHPLPRKSISRLTRLNVFAKYNGRCSYCGCELEITEMQVDHFIPHMNRGGEDSLDNYYPACEVCNRVKSDRTIEGFKNAIRHCGEIHRKRKTPIMADSDKIAMKYELTKEDHEIKFFYEKYDEEPKCELEIFNLIQGGDSKC